MSTQSNAWSSDSSPILDAFLIFSRASWPLLATVDHQRVPYTKRLALLTVASQIAMLQLPRQHSLIDQVIFHNQNVRFSS